MAKTPDLSPVTPGEILMEEFLKPLGLTAYRLSKATNLPQTRISEIIHGRRGISPDTALRFGRALGTTAEFWLNLQAFYDLETVRRSDDSPVDDVQVLVSA